MYRNVLVPTDGSDPAARAVEQAIELADKFDATLHVLFAADVDERTPLDLSRSQVVESVREHGRTLVDGVDERSPDDLEVTTAVVDGDPREVILEYTEHEDIDVAVMGTHGRRGVDRLLLGSVAEHVMRNADCSVLVARATVDEEPVDEPDAAIEVARDALEAADGIDTGRVTIADDVREVGGHWIVSAATTERAFAVYVSRVSGTARIADVTGE
ncbi:universal stress protein [Natronobacterium gregoryi]|uniref:Universal stress protein n=2 Tax=Natronobacterium gregoryi TaxID=44930 RepID=L0AH34_NATGS|nr:universal stress protein [Natronobacterium gregoryi]AFZ73203.1 universal stress protein UspA-like protein [Natronobacterium gregoryi SP2]ELY71339.1 UspA domain-containing protein [Natronobacterium gregoryi SP2]PLK21611.1 universal stress protein [Natronobacterium gregoryi SP2]SFI58522.1 Nucleotide-binding universal stress protein, UspA family [Natronobacterium gregoryi]